MFARTRETCASVSDVQSMSHQAQAMSHQALAFSTSRGPCHVGQNRQCTHWPVRTAPTTGVPIFSVWKSRVRASNFLCSFRSEDSGGTAYKFNSIILSIMLSIAILKSIVAPQQEIEGNVIKFGVTRTACTDCMHALGKREGPATFVEVSSQLC